MTIKQRIISCLQDSPKGINDDDLARILGLKSRQQANARCRQLENEGFIIRRHVDGKIHNFLTEKPLVIIPILAKKVDLKDTPKFDIWFWEGNVQSKVVTDLLSKNYHILSEADTASHQQGIDIVAEKDDVQL
jgi:hypothetical protein